MLAFGTAFRQADKKRAKRAKRAKVHSHHICGDIAFSMDSIGMPIVSGKGKQLKKPHACCQHAMPRSQSLKAAGDKAWQGLGKALRP